MNYLIFGGSGFIGTHLIHRLKDACVKPGDCIYDLDLVMPGVVEKTRGSSIAAWMCASRLLLISRPRRMM